jgi:enoyl-CoA hydratase
MESTLLIEDTGDGIVQVALNRPERLNALTADLVEELHDQFRQLAFRRDVRAIVLTGAGRGFCSGLDLNGYGTPLTANGVGPLHASWSVQQHISSLITEMRGLPQPIIAAVNGPAAGGGLALMLASDIRLASQSATCPKGSSPSAPALGPMRLQRSSARANWLFRFGLAILDTLSRLR